MFLAQSPETSTPKSCLARMFPDCKRPSVITSRRIRLPDTSPACGSEGRVNQLRSDFGFVHHNSPAKAFRSSDCLSSARALCLRS